MKRFCNVGNNTDTHVIARTYPTAMVVANSGQRAMGAMLVLAAAGLLFLSTLPVAAQVRPQTGINSGAAVDRESARRSMESFRNRMQRGHQRGQDRALDTNERVRRDRERQIQRLDDLRRQRSR